MPTSIVIKLGRTHTRLLAEELALPSLAIEAPGAA